MFIVLLSAAVLLGCPVLAPAQSPDRCVQNADGTWTCPGLNGTTVTCPILAPPLPAALAAEAAATSPEEPATAADRLTLRQRREMGFTRLAAIRAAARLVREGALPSTRGLVGEDLAAAEAEIKEAIAAEILGDNIQAWQSNVQDGRDFSAFFEALMAFLEKILPLILQLFGGLAQNAPLVPTAVAHASPLLILAA
jgi:hypothetical protein